VTQNRRKGLYRGLEKVVGFDVRSVSVQAGADAKSAGASGWCRISRG
jgi:hypothetical protein